MHSANFQVQPLMCTFTPLGESIYRRKEMFSIENSSQDIGSIGQNGVAIGYGNFATAKLQPNQTTQKSGSSSICLKTGSKWTQWSEQGSELQAFPSGQKRIWFALPFKPQLVI